MGEIVCLLLRSLAARTPRRIVLTAIHTPSSRVFSLFTHVTLLTSTGELGTAVDVLDWFGWLLDVDVRNMCVDVYACIVLALALCGWF